MPSNARVAPGRRIVAAAAASSVVAATVVAAAGPREVAAPTYHVAVAVAVVLAAVACRRAGTGASWGWLVGGFALFGLGDLAWDVLPDALVAGGVVAPADLAYWCGYAAYAVGLGRLLGPSRRDRVGLADGAIFAVASALVLWQVEVAPAIGDGTVAERLVAVSYPMLDLILLAAAVWLVLGGERAVPARLLALHLGAFVALDVLWNQLASGPGPERVLSALYLPAYTLLVAAAAHPAARDLARRRRDGLHAGRLFLLGGAVLVAPSAGVVAAIGGGSTAWVLVPLSALLSVLVVARFGRVVLRTERQRAELVVARGALEDARRQAEERSLTDPLTGLANRRAVRAHLEATLAAGPCAVWSVDLDRFKGVNDTLGHAAGDEVLVVVAARLQAEGRAVDAACARMGGDEFVVVAALGDPTQAAAVGGRLVRALAVPVVVQGEEFELGASVGVAVARVGDAPDQVLHDADLAMLAAKQAGGREVVLFDRAMREELQRRVTLERALRRALGRDELVLHYQPIVAPGVGPIGVEALLRWHHEDTLLLPAAFIDLAEDSGLLLPIGAWVLATACAQLARWDDEGLLVERLYVNVSGRQLRSTRLASDVRQALAASGIDPARLTLELNENALSADIAMAGELLADLRSTGARLAIDDFGTGFSSLAHLHRLPLDEVKLDRSFSGGLIGVGDQSVVLGALVELIHGLGRTVVLEGIETAEQLDAAGAVGIDAVQGYHLSRPVAAEALPRVLARLLAPQVAPARSRLRALPEPDLLGHLDAATHAGP